MPTRKVVEGCCLTCINACGVLVSVEDGKIAKVEGNPRHPFSRGILCPKGLALKHIVYHPDRLKHPLKRAGERGESKWKQISWDEALDEIASKLAEVKDKYGAEAIALSGGFNAVASLSQSLGMFLHFFGSPNRLVNVHVCAMPAHMAGVYTSGFTIMSPDYPQSKCILLWGISVENAWRSQRQEVLEALSKGAKLIVVDPRRTSLAARADIWMQVRPGTDCALALGMLHVIINERLYDEAFVQQWTSGFDKLRQHVQQYSPEKVEEITWVLAQTIREAARLYAQNRPSSVSPGASGMCQSITAFQGNRALAIMAAITGNLDIPGGNVHYLSPLRRRSAMAGEMDASFGKMPPEQLQKRLGGDTFRIVSHAGLIFAHPAAVWKAILESKPYPLKALLGFGGNHIVSFENSSQVRKALLGLEFYATASLFMTPTAEIADIVLPAAHWTERDEIIDFYVKNWVFCHQKAIEPLGECRDDKKVLIELAKRLGLEGYWRSLEEYFDYKLEPLGMTLDQFKEKGMLEGPVEYQKYEKAHGFRTSTGKVDLYSETLEKLGYEPLPTPHEPPESPLSTPDLAQEYPLILITGVKLLPYNHTDLRHVPQLRKLYPDPLLEIHPDTATKLGIKENDWVLIETPRGKVKHRARLFSGIHPQVVSASHGWWYGYQDGWKEVNINILTEDQHFDPQVGSAPLKGLLCKVSKIQDDGLPYG